MGIIMVDETQSVSLSGGEEVLVTIPEGATNVQVELTGPSALDLALDAGETEIVDWQNGMISGLSGGSTTYQSAEIDWSGYAGTETLTIDGPVPEDLSLILDAFGSGGAGEISYSWDNGGQDNGGGNNVNEAPEGTDDTLTATAGEALTISPETLLANDSDPDGDALNIVGAGDPENGSLDVEPASGPITSLTFTPDQGVEDASFKYVINDGEKNDIVDVDLNVQPSETDDALTAQADQLSWEDAQVVVAEAQNFLNQDGVSNFLVSWAFNLIDPTGLFGALQNATKIDLTGAADVLTQAVPEISYDGDVPNNSYVYAEVGDPVGLGAVLFPGNEQTKLDAINIDKQVYDQSSNSNVWVNYEELEIEFDENYSADYIPDEVTLESAHTFDEEGVYKVSFETIDAPADTELNSPVKLKVVGAGDIENGFVA